MEEVVQKNSKKRRSFEKLLQDFLDDVTGSDEENMSQIQVEPETKASVVIFCIKNEELRLLHWDQLNPNVYFLLHLSLLHRLECQCQKIRMRSFL